MRTLAMCSTVNAPDWIFSKKLSVYFWTLEVLAKEGVALSNELTEEWLLRLAAVETTAAAEKNPSELRQVGQAANDILKAKHLIDRSISDLSYLDIDEKIRTELIKIQEDYFFPRPDHPDLRRGLKEGYTYHVLDGQVKSFKFEPIHFNEIYIQIKGTLYISCLDFKSRYDPVSECKKKFSLTGQEKFILVAYGLDESLSATPIEGVYIGTVKENLSYA